MHSQNIDYAAIKDRLKNLQPKNRAETRYAQLANLREAVASANKQASPGLAYTYTLTDLVSH